MQQFFLLLRGTVQQLLQLLQQPQLLVLLHLLQQQLSLSVVSHALLFRH